MQAIKTSPSQIKTRGACELLYAFSYTDLLKRMPQEGDYARLLDLLREEGARRIAIDYNVNGSVAHSMFERFFKKKYKTRDSYAHAGTGAFKWWAGHNPMAVRNLWRIPYYNVVGFYINRMESMLRLFFDEHEHQRDETHEIEQPFDLIVQNSGMIVNVSGKKDRVVFRKDEDEIIDYKTSARPRPVEMLRADPQFLAYSIDHERRYGRRPAFTFSHTGLDGNRQRPTRNITLRISDDDHRLLEDMALESARRTQETRENVKNEKMITPSYGDHCRFCPHSYLGDCDAYTGNNKFSRHDQKAVVMFPPEVKVKHKKKPEGQKRFHWPAGEAITVGSGQAAEKE